MDDRLDEDQAATWSAHRRVHVRLMAGLDRQLTRDSGMPQGYFAVFATLAGSPERRLLLADLPRARNISQSRLSHAVARSGSGPVAGQLPAIGCEPPWTAGSRSTSSSPR